MRRNARMYFHCSTRGKRISFPGVLSPAPCAVDFPSMSDAETRPGSEEPLVPAVTVQLTRVDIARWNNNVQNQTSPGVTWLFRYIPAGILLLLAILNFTVWDSPSLGTQALITTAAWFWALGWPIHWVLLWRWGSRLGTDGLPQATTLFPTLEGLHMGDDFRAWNEMLRSERSGSYLYLFPDETRAVVVPRRCFPNRAAYSGFVEVCQRRIGEAGQYRERPDDDPPPDAIRYTLSTGSLVRRNDEFLRRVGVRGPLWLRLPFACLFAVISVAMWPWWQGLSALLLGPGNLLMATWTLLPAPYERWVARSQARKLSQSRIA